MAPICHHLTGNGINYGIYLLFTKIETPRKLSVCKGFGGEREIRTLGTVLAYTRFPVVRLRPDSAISPYVHGVRAYARLLCNCTQFILFDIGASPYIFAVNLSFNCRSNILHYLNLVVNLFFHDTRYGK